MGNDVRISWNGIGGELDSVVVNVADDDMAITNAFIGLLKGNIVSPGDWFSVVAIQD